MLLEYPSRPPRMFLNPAARAVRACCAAAPCLGMADAAQNVIDHNITFAVAPRACVLPPLLLRFVAAR
jgi:hypothetical protein